MTARETMLLTREKSTSGVKSSPEKRLPIITFVNVTTSAGKNPICARISRIKTFARPIRINGRGLGMTLSTTKSRTAIIEYAARMSIFSVDDFMLYLVI